MKIEKIKTKTGKTEEHIILNPKKDKCPICDTPLNEVRYKWQMFHGEGQANCCGASYQLKSYYVDIEKVGQKKKDFAESLDSPNRIELNLDMNMIKPIRQAILELGVTFIQTREVADRAREIMKL